ncbi:hypothetical protein [Rhizobium giardinii]|uniref:Transmembrane protein n=1 Tax=Rhizobium giardinii TaxID=56731 RepID=A0A7W8UBH0_9HYPH|nr:hypothetical protein [Rhizobium giardinii]MBB5535020.1 hypothetical protein [Rhizobium giardinii]
MSERALLSAMGALEAATGLALLIIPTVLVGLLLGTAPDTAAGMTVSRVAGAALLALGIACWFTREDRSRGLLAAMVIYNAAVVVVLFAGWIGSGLSGVAFWPAILVHAALAFWCIVYLSPSR